MDVGDYGSDSAIFNISTFGKALKNNTLNLPHSDCLPGTTAYTRYYFVGDVAFLWENTYGAHTQGKFYLRSSGEVRGSACPARQD